MRRPAALLFTTIVPAVFALFAFARPARLFAESSAPGPCRAEEFAACGDSGVAGRACVFGGLASTCKPGTCEGAEGSRSTLVCPFPAACINPGSLADCEGKAEGEACRGGHVCGAGDCQRALDDGGREPVLVCRAVACTSKIPAAARCEVGAACGDDKTCRRAGCADDQGNGWIDTQERVVCAGPCELPGDDASGCALGGEGGIGDGRGAVGLGAVFVAAFGLAWTRRSRRRG